MSIPSRIDPLIQSAESYVLAQETSVLSSGVNSSMAPVSPTVQKLRVRGLLPAMLADRWDTTLHSPYVGGFTRQSLVRKTMALNVGTAARW